MNIFASFRQLLKILHLGIQLLDIPEKNDEEDIFKSYNRSYN